MIQPNISDSQSSSIHGTIDIVVSTRTGFVLATDSRGTDLATRAHVDNMQKLFAIGPHAACVIAGLVGQDWGAQGFHLREALGSHLTHLAELAERDSRLSSTDAIVRSFRFGLDGVAGLIPPGTTPSPYFVGAVSAVSINQNGEPHWTTLLIPLKVVGVGNDAVFTPGEPKEVDHKLLSGMRFDVEALGVLTVAEEMLRASKPSPANEFTKTNVMRKYYLRKATGRLDDFTILEALDLAKTLVKATVRYADSSAGVGGSIDTLTVTKNGVQWHDKKTDVAALPRPHLQQLYKLSLEGPSFQRLDGLICVLCSFKNMTLFYGGDGDVELLGAKFEGTCEVRIAPEARIKSPQVTQRLTDSLRGKCVIK